MMVLLGETVKWRRFPEDLFGPPTHYYTIADANAVKCRVGWTFTYRTSAAAEQQRQNPDCIEAFEQMREENSTTAAMKGCLQSRALSSKDKLLLREMGLRRGEPTLSSYYLWTKLNVCILWVKRYSRDSAFIKQTSLQSPLCISVQRQYVCSSSRLLSSGHIAPMLRASEVPAINSVHYVGKLMKWVDFKRALPQINLYGEALWECYICLILTTIGIKGCCLPLRDKRWRSVCFISFNES